MQQISPYYPILLQQNSPLTNAAQDIKNYFNALNSKLKQFPKIQHGFQSKPSPKHICTKILKPGQKYFHCQVCSFDSDQDMMIFCTDCFDHKLHEGHKFQQKTVQNQKCSCDCGRKLRIKKQSTCQSHANKNKQIQINKDELQKFVKYFSKWFEIVFFLRQNQIQLTQIEPLLKILSSTLVQLCQNSLQYVKMIIQLFNTPIKVNNGKQYKIKDQIFKYIAFVPILMQIIGDQSCLLEYGQIFDKIQKQRNIQTYPIFHFNQFRKQLLSSQTFLLQMSNKNVYFTQCFHHYFELASNCETEQQKNKKIYELIKNMLKPMQQNQYLTTLYQIFKTGDTSLLSSVQMIDQIYDKAIKSFYIQSQTNANKQGQDQQMSSQLKRKVLKSSFLVVKMIYQKCNNKIQNIPAWIDKTYQNQQQKVKFQVFVQYIIIKKAFNQLLIATRRRAALLILLALEKHSKKDQLYEKLWLQILDMQKSLNQNLDKVYDFVGFLANSHQVFPILAVNEEQNILSQDQLRKSVFKSSLYQNKQIPKRQLWQQFYNGWLKGINAGQIVNKLCKYNDAHDNFVYSSEDKYPNKLVSLPQAVTRNWENIRKLDINYNSQKIGSSKMLKNIMLGLFQSQIFFNLLQQNFIKGLEMLQKQPRTLQKWKQKRIGQNYILLLLIIDKLCHGEQNFFMKDQLEKIKHNIDQYRFRFTQIGIEENIKKILCIELPKQQQVPKQQQNKQKAEQAQKQKQKTQQQLAKQQLKRKAQLKKQQIQNKMKQKQQQILQKLKNQKSSIVQEQQQQNFCLSCKQRQKKDNQFVYMINLLKGSTISKILHGEQSKTSARIKTNLHAIHMKCFMDTKKKNMEFQCQLCKQQINCFLPYKPNKASKKTLQICWNVMNALLVSVHNIYDTGCLFSILFESLVQSLGFNQLISAKKSKALYKAKQKTDRYILELLICLYSFGSPEQQQKYNQIYKQFKQKIKTCTKRQLQYFQLVIVDACFDRIAGVGQIDQKMLQQLGKMMYQHQLEVLKNILQFITEGSTDLSSLEFISLENITSNKQKSNQIVQLQKITSLNQLKQQQTQQVQKPQNNQDKNIMSQSPLATEKPAYQKKMLGININLPPKTIKQLSSPTFLQSWTKTKSPKCSSCEGDQVKVLCLLCRRIFCQKCQQDQFHSQMHLGNIITLNISNGSVSIQKSGKTQTFDLYFNQFMIEYKKAKKDFQNQDSEDNQQSQIAAMFRKKKKKNKKKVEETCQFKLNQVRFNELLEKFYNLSA